MAVTMMQIADRMGLAQGTISRALRDDPLIAAKTRKRVKQLADEMGYRPNRLARQLARGKTDTVTLLAPDLTNPFFSEYLDVLDRHLQKRGYHAIHLCTHHSIQREEEMLGWLPGRYADGAICLCYDEHNQQNYRQLDDKLPLVVRTSKGYDPPPCRFARVEIDEEPSIMELMRHFREMGKTRVGLLTCGTGGATFEHTWDNPALRTYRQAMLAAGLEPDIRRVRMTPQADGVEVFYRAACDLLKTCPEIDALLVRRLMWVPAVYQAIGNAGRRVGEDIAVASYDNPPEAAFMNPAVTVLCEPVQTIARHLADLLLDRIKNPSQPAKTIEVTKQLILRRSTTGRDGETTIIPSTRGNEPRGNET
jgi:LacI family transcriptional regulator